MRSARRGGALAQLVAALFFLLALVSGRPARAQSNFVYVYDEVGRLVGVVNPTGNAAVYSYDAVGNLLSISQYPSSSVSIIYFTPSSGPTGTTVTISGTGFSTTPSQNAVTFNGTAATVASSSATQIVATVPSNATTGPIKVTVAANSATSSKAFTVGAAQAPTVTSFSPTIGTPGTAIAVTGANFQTTASNDKATFNKTASLVASATSTSLSTNVPSNAGSGRIAVSTPYGTGVSSGDFFIPPPPYTPSSVGPTGRMSVGAMSTVTVAAGQVGLMLFDGTATQRVSAVFTFPTCVAPNSPTSDLFLGTNGARLASDSGCGGSPPTDFIDATRLPTSGTYTIELASQGNNAASPTISLYNVVDVAAPITIGTPLTVNTNTPGQDARLTFSLTQSQRVSVYSTAQPPSLCLFNYILDSNGNSIARTTGTWHNCVNDYSFVDATTLPTGNYSVLVDPQGPGTGSLTTTIYNVVDATGSVTIKGGKAKTFSNTTMGQNISVAFSGTAGQLATVHLTNSSFTYLPFTNTACVYVTLFSTDNTTSLSFSSSCSSSVNLSQVTLPNTGTYTVYIDPQDVLVGSITVAVTSP